MSAKPKDVTRKDIKDVFPYISLQRTVVRLTSAQLSSLKFPLSIASDLHRSGKIDLPTKLKLELAFQEALTNSLEHGNLELRSEWKEAFCRDGIDSYSKHKSERLKDPSFADRWIHMEIEYNGENLCILIRDQGPGFDLDRVEEALKKEDQSHGRGLALIQAAMDEVSYDENGTVVRMVKRVTPKQ